MSEPPKRFFHALSILLIVAIVSPAWAQEVSPKLLQMAMEAYQQQQEEQSQPQILRPARVDPKLVGKKVVVRTRDGRILAGKLLEVEPDFLLLRWGRRTEQLSLREVFSVEKQPLNKWKIAVIVYVVVATVTVLTVDYRTQRRSYLTN